ncbi:PIG-L family deacetylase [Saccharothrix sp. Mg75]|uniref:PIG-L family deacetylase n=1 Tax=Saccharothrix sp. Mg75 TaxID=3445357 RepID=UPI003EEEB7A9
MRRASAAVLVVVLVVVGWTPPAAAVAAGLTMQVVAHEDDDLLFMNPDLDQTIRTRTPTVTVFVTAGQITGAGGTDEERARNRQRGIQDAYARMAGVPDVDPGAQEEWRGALVPVAGRQAERYVLAGRDDVQLVFLNLRDGRLGAVRDSGAVDLTVVPAGGLVTTSYSYDRAGVVAALAGLMDAYRPTLVRAQDPLPDARYAGDHSDHVAAARFADDAVRAHGGQPAQVHYRDYNNTSVPNNLSASTLARKSSIFDQYLRYDGNTGLRGYLAGMNHRWPRGTAWSGRNADGRPQLFVVRGGVPHTYWQTPSGPWAGPGGLPDPGGPLAQGLAVALGPDGRLELFARRQTDHHLLSLRQTAPNGGWSGPWTDLGNPNTAFGNADQVGLPAVAANADGRLQVFVKNGGGGVSAKHRTATGWSDWVDLFGTDVQDGLTAVTTPGGTVELFASTRSRLLRWYQAQPNGTFTRDETLPSAVPAGPPSATLAQDGRVEVLYRRAGTEEVVLTVRTAAGWAGPVVLGGHGGVGQVAAVTAPPGADARVVVLQRNGGTGVSAARQQGPNAGYGTWTDLGGVVADSPTAVRDARGALVVAAVGTDGAVHLRTQQSATADSPFGPWQRL